MPPAMAGPRELTKSIWLVWTGLVAQLHSDQPEPQEVAGLSTSNSNASSHTGRLKLLTASLPGQLPIFCLKPDLGML